MEMQEVESFTVLIPYLEYNPVFCDEDKRSRFLRNGGLFLADKPQRLKGNNNYEGTNFSPD